MPTTRDYYEILSVEKTASGEEIKRSYRRLAMKYHPDRNPGDAQAEARFKEAAEAYEVLSDAERRASYDRFGHAGLRGTPGHDFRSMNVEDIFSMFNDIFGGTGFGTSGAPGAPGAPGPGGGRGQRSRGVPRGYDLETEVEVTLEEVLVGAHRDVQFKRLDVCKSCSGTGAKPGTKPVTCSACGGQGQVAQSGLGGMFRMVTTCPQCRGAGEVVTDKCADCRGRGRVSVSRKLTVKIPPGVHDGVAVRVAGEGEPPPRELSAAGEGVRGDLHVAVRVRPHDRFERDGDHLLLAVPMAFTQAALGSRLDIPTLDAATTFDVPPGTQHGAIFRLAGHGLPNLRNGKRGDLIIVAQLIVPRKLNDEQRRLLTQFAQTEEIDVGADDRPSWWDKFKGAMTGT